MVQLDCTYLKGDPQMVVSSRDIYCLTEDSVIHIMLLGQCSAPNALHSAP